MSATQSNHGAVIKAAQGETIPGSYFKAMFWCLNAATVNTDLLELTEKDASGHVIYPDAAPKTHGAVPIPCPDKPVDDIYVKTCDNGFVLAYPRDDPSGLLKEFS